MPLVRYEGTWVLHIRWQTPFKTMTERVWGVEMEREIGTEAGGSVTAPVTISWLRGPWGAEQRNALKPWKIRNKRLLFQVLSEDGRHRTDDQSKKNCFISVSSQQKRSHNPKLGKNGGEITQRIFFFLNSTKINKLWGYSHVHTWKLFVTADKGSMKILPKNTVILPQFCRYFPSCCLCAMGEVKCGLLVGNRAWRDRGADYE